MHALKFSTLTAPSMLVLALTMLSVSACVAPYTEQELKVVDNAMITGNTSRLRGRTSYLYQRQVRQRRVQQAARNLDPSGLDYLEIGLYREEVAKIDRQKVEARLQQERLAEQQELERQRAIEEQRLAAIAAKADAELLAAREARRLATQKENERQSRILAEKNYQKKIEEPIHEEWNEDIDLLTEHFESNDFMPADRLASVYARTMQLLVNGSADTDRMSKFFAKLSDAEQTDYNRLFTDQAGIELVADFWSKHKRAGLVPPLSTN